MSPGSRVDWTSVSAAVLQALQANRARLDVLDSVDHDHGERLQVLWQRLDDTVRAHPDLAPPELFVALERVLEGLPQDEGRRAYQAVLARLNTAWQAGELDEERLIDLARRLVGGDPQGDDSRRRLSGALSGLIRSLGGTARARRLAERFGVSGLLAGGLDMAAGEPGGALRAGTAFLVGQSPLAEAPHLAESGRLILQTLLLEIDRQVGPRSPHGG